eukprot:8256608-Alexandrium_andersonii.AAC.1
MVRIADKRGQRTVQRLIAASRLRLPAGYTKQGPDDGRVAHSGHGPAGAGAWPGRVPGCAQASHHW